MQSDDIFIIMITIAAIAIYASRNKRDDDIIHPKNDYTITFENGKVSKK